jgi:hypothetical protein
MLISSSKEDISADQQAIWPWQHSSSLFILALSYTIFLLSQESHLFWYKFLRLHEICVFLIQCLNLDD